ncbi:hypothetical protein I2486_07930 [Cellulophaga sp. E16_2]|uniref:hypothetical protein n=1 Tax=Cellulophaga sp. E16_2 TaxID=2789297 RepID=UPI001A924238|nr:hypothetical protein [Cellulophaga sp. E16_2]MBO0591335.1 hypothetical protein [Cellulophaga sp. E16_2]
MSTLTKDQLLTIETYLNQKDLTQIDLRNEVLDHIANGIEATIKSENCSFEEAFNKEVITWNKELGNYSSWWLGIAWVGPKIMMKKCVRIVKKSYLKALKYTISAFLIIYLLNAFLDLSKYSSVLNTMIGIVYLTIGCMAIILYRTVRKSSYKTSYSFLFSRQVLPNIFIYFLMNPLFFEVYQIGINKSSNIFMLFIHLFSISFAFIIYDLFKSHMDIKKMKLA